MALAKERKELKVIATKTDKIGELLAKARDAADAAWEVLDAAESESKHRNIFFGDWRSEVLQMKGTLDTVVQELSTLAHNDMNDLVSSLEKASEKIEERAGW